MNPVAVFPIEYYKRGTYFFAVDQILLILSCFYETRSSCSSCSCLFGLILKLKARDRRGPPLLVLLPIEDLAGGLLQGGGWH